MNFVPRRVKAGRDESKNSALRERELEPALQELAKPNRSRSSRAIEALIVAAQGLRKRAVEQPEDIEGGQACDAMSPTATRRVGRERVSVNIS
jgi:hypothetical protein